MFSLVFFSGKQLTTTSSAYAAIEAGQLDQLINVFNSLPDIINHTDSTKYSLLHVAVNHQQIDCVRFLIDKGANVDCNVNENGTPLHTAVRKNNLDIAKLLLENKASVTSTKIGFTPLHEVRSIEMLDLLMHYGANINHVCTASLNNAWRGNSVLFSAILNDHPHQLLERMFRLGAKGRITNKNGNTIFHALINQQVGFEVTKEYKQKFNLFLQYGANPLLANHKNRNPSELTFLDEPLKGFIKTMQQEYVKLMKTIIVLKFIVLKMLQSPESVQPLPLEILEIIISFWPENNYIEEKTAKLMLRTNW